ncbi:MAG: HemK/PrmC family methyltransferase [Myxococcota bacterium]
MMTTTAQLGVEIVEKQTHQEDGWTILKLMRWCQKYFATKGLDQPRMDTEVLLGHTLGMSRVQLYTHFDRPLDAHELAEFKAIIKRRVAREPVAYIVGHKEFWSLTFKVDPRVLIPRPDTELLVQMARERARQIVGDPAAKPPQMDDFPDDLDAQRRREMTAMPVSPPQEHEEEEGQVALDDEDAEDRDGTQAVEGEPVLVAADGEEELPAWEPQRPVRMLDVGTGSGAVAVALAVELPYAQVVATDISAEALAVARSNAETLVGEGRITLLEGDLLAPTEGMELFDVIVSNPPYIAEPELEAIMPDVALHEPKLALTGGADGLDVLRRLADEAWSQLAPGGTLLCEIGYDQETTVQELFVQSPHPWARVRVTRDPLTHHPRVVEAHKP